MKAYKAIILTIIISSFISLTATAQRNYTQEADDAFKLEQYNVSIDKYKKAYTKVKQNRAEKNRILFQIAEAYRLTNNTKNSEIAYKRAIKSNYFKQEPRVYLYLADALRVNQKYDEALDAYQKYLKLVPTDEKGLNGLASCKVATEWVNKPTRYEVTNMKRWNTRDNEWAPAFSDRKKYNELVYTTTGSGVTGKGEDAWTGSGFSDFFVVRQDRRGNWDSPQSFESELMLNTEVNEGEASFSENGNTIYFTRCGVEKKKKLGCLIYTSKKKGKGWDEAEIVSLGSEDYDYVHPAISGDELTIYFSSNIPNGLGEFDIWVAKRDKKTKPFDKPVNLGPNINTVGKEMFPTLRYDTALYFSSNARIGLGGFDIYKTVKVKDEWMPAQNMGSPVNSYGDDMSMVFYPDGERGFFSSNRKEGRGGDDIWSFVLPPLLYTITGTVRDDNTLQLLENVVIKMVGSDGTAVETKTNKKGLYKFDNKQVLPGVTYTLTVKKDKYFGEEGKISTVGMNANKDFVYDFKSRPIPKDPILLPEILYDLGRWELKEQYQDSLIDLIKTLEKNPTIVIELRSHTDSRNIKMTNDTLSQLRAQSVVDYLILRGIAAGRLVARGYGAKIPRTLIKETVAKYKDKFYTFPSGITLTDEYVKAIKNVDEREAAFSLNRRTEFSILRDDFVPMPKNDTLPISNVQIVNNPLENSIEYTIGTNGVQEIPCIINSVALKMAIDEKAKSTTISYDDAITFLQAGRISKNDFKENEKAIDKEGNIVEKSTLIIKSIKLGNSEINNVEAIIMKNMKVSLIIDKTDLNKFGTVTIDKEKKKITIN
ncbi:MAG: PD40 domain-containing protein [Bacteroidetes bacterium]|nr:PD40 domain-containing protein [Bacteroidota bacterium]